MIILQRQIGADAMLAVWQMDDAHGMKPRQHEQYCEHQLFKAMFGHDVEIAHDASGKPIIENANISISHTRGFVAIIVSKKNQVGIDIEYQSNRVGKIASRFLRADEPATTIREQLIMWCAKEAVYKLFSADDLTFEQMRVSMPDDVSNEKPAVDAGIVTAENIKRNVKVDVSYLVTSAFTLTYVIG